MTTKEYLSTLRDMYVRLKSLDNYPKEQEQWKLWYNRNVDRIHGMKNSRNAALLEYRYVRGMTWDEITDKLGLVNADYVRRRLHLRALQEFEREYQGFINDYPRKNQV